MTGQTFKVLPETCLQPVPSRLIPKSSFTSDRSNELTSSFFDAEDGSVNAGIWECPPCKMHIPSYPVNEMMTIITGTLIITNSEGNQESFGPGEVLFVSKGSEMTWQITEHLRKYYMNAN